jgi:hypothetical protein
MTLERGAKYVLCFLLTFPHVPLIVIAGAALARRDARYVPIARHSLLIVLAVLGYATVVGGDFMPMGRFIVPALPFVTLLFALLLRALSRRLAPAIGCAVGAIALSILPAWDVHVVPHDVRAVSHFRWKIRRFRSEVRQWEVSRDRTMRCARVGRTVGEHTKPGETTVCGAVGAIGYYSRLFIYDMCGLVTAEVAHLPVRHRSSAGHDKAVLPEFFLKNKPTYYTFVVCPSAVKLPVPHGSDGLTVRFDDLPRVLRVVPPVLRDLPAEVQTDYAPVLIPLRPTVEISVPRVLVLVKRKMPASSPAVSS